MERRDPRMPGQDRTDCLALDADPTAVDDPHLAKTRGDRRLEVGAHHLGDIPRRESVEIDRILDRHDHLVGELVVRVVS